MNNFNLLKLDRAVWVAYLCQKEITEAVKYYEMYCNTLAKIKDYNDAVVKEIEYCKQLFQEKVMELAQNYVQENNFAKAVIAYSAAFKNNDKDIDCIKNYISCLDEIKQYDLEASMLLYLEEFCKNDIEIYRSLSQIYEKRKLFIESVEYMEKYIDAKGSENVTANDYNALGCLYDNKYSEETHKREDIEKSLLAFDKASDMEPDERLFAKNATIMAGKGNNYKMGRKHWDRLLKINKFNNDDKYDYAAFSLRNCEFDSWYEYYDFRFQKENNATFFPQINGTKWDGIQDLSQSTLLVHCEQGFGDTFLMWGYIPRLIKLAKHVIFVTQDETYELLKNNEYGVEIYSRDYINFDEIKFDYYLPSMSIPTALRVTRENICVGAGYLKPNIELVNSFKEKYFNNNKFKIGIAFIGNVDGERSRDIKINEMISLDELNNVEIYNFTKNVEDSEFEIFNKNKVVNIAKDFHNFADTAAALANCDCILSSDNCILNLAGAMGIKTFGLFNWSYFFRWFDIKGEDAGWYTSVKPYICDDIDNWQSAVKPAIKDIKKLIY